MFRAVRLLLATVLTVPAPAWAAGNVQTRAVSPVAAPAPAAVRVPAIPGLPQTAVLGPATTPALPAAGQAPAAAAAPPAAAAAAIPPAAAAAAIPAAAASGSALSLPSAAQQTPGETPRTALERLQAEVPLEQPQPGDAEGSRAFATNSFDFKVGAAGAHDVRATKPPSGGGSGGGAGPGGGPTSGGGAADDGGGPQYPGRSIRFRGKDFRASLFRPNTPVEPEIIRAIESADKSIHLALYEFKLTGVLDALRAARARGVEIHIILDYSNVFPVQEEGSTYRPRRSREIWALLREGFDVKVLRGLSDYGINHNKFAVIDHGEKETMSVFGSYNWAWTAENSHYENINFSVERPRATALKSYWDWLDSMAQPEAVARDFKWPMTVPAPPVSIAETINFNGIDLPPLVLSPDPRPGKSIEERLVQAIDASAESVDISVFALRSTLIAEALARAHQRKIRGRQVKVRVIMDQGQSVSGPFGMYAQWLAARGVELRTLAGPDPNSSYPMAQKLHHKFGIFDGKLVETGSANYTKYAAHANYENAHFLNDKRDAQSYQWIYDRMFSRAKPFPAPPSAPSLPTDDELNAEVGRPPRPHPGPKPHPGPDPAVRPAAVAFHRATLPSYAFRPDTPIEPLIVQAIDAAEKSVRLAVYEFNLESVMEALRRAKQRNLKIEIVVDRSHVYTTGKDHTGKPRKPSPEIQALIAEGFDILTLKGQKGGIMHNKYLLLDAETPEGLVMFGSYNLADTAEHHHYENVSFSNDRHDLADYLAYFDYKRGHASGIDHDKLEDVLSRGLESDIEDASPERMSHEERDSKFEAPPESTAPEIDLNGVKFKRRYFSPQGGVMDAWIRAIHAAKSSVDIAMFGFYSREIADALVQAAAAKNGLKVRLWLDAGQSALVKFDDIPMPQWFAQKGFDVRMKAGPNEDGDPMFEKQHNKFMMIDGKFLMTGSFNASPTAENFSFENENITDNPVNVAGFAEYFARNWALGWPPRGAVVSAAAAETASVPESVPFAGF